MKRVEVISSDIKTVGYDYNNNILEIEFHSRGIYQYYNVSEDAYISLINASSKGSFFHKNIKDRYTFHQIR